MSDSEVQELKESIENLERRIDKLEVQVRQKPTFLWREFWIGFSVVFVVMMVFTIALILFQHHSAAHVNPFDPLRRNG